MQFKIRIINVASVTKPAAKGSYIQLDVAFTNLSSNKTEGKKIMSFALKETYEALKNATNGEEYTITTKKNEKTGYWDWVGATKDGGGGGGQTVPAPKGNASPKSTYETPEERAQKQVYIVRQSSLTNAIATMKLDKAALDPADVIRVAQMYEDYVFQKPIDEDSPIKGFDSMDDDIPM